MGWILLESLVALIALVLIVWWTMRGPRSRDSVAPRAQHPPDDDAP